MEIPDKWQIQNQANKKQKNIIYIQIPMHKIKIVQKKKKKGKQKRLTWLAKEAKMKSTS